MTDDDAARVGEQRADDVLGLAFGLLLWPTPAARPNLEHAGTRFREQPTPELQRAARESIRTAMSPNERLELIHHWPRLLRAARSGRCEACLHDLREFAPGPVQALAIDV